MDVRRRSYIRVNEYSGCKRDVGEAEWKKVLYENILCVGMYEAHKKCKQVETYMYKKCYKSRNYVLLLNVYKLLRLTTKQKPDQDEPLTSSHNFKTGIIRHNRTSHH